MELRAVLFDLDGTLADTSQDISMNINRALDGYGAGTLSHERIMGHLGYGAQTLIRRCLEDLLSGENIPEDDVLKVLDSFRDYYAANLTNNTSIYPGVENFLAGLNCPLGVISNKPERFVKGVLQELNMLNHFVFAWGKDSTTRPKPDPGVILEGLELLDLEPGKDILFIGDNPVDIRSARGAGVSSVGILHGYSSRNALEAEKPDLLVHGYEELGLKLASFPKS